MPSSFPPRPVLLLSLCLTAAFACKKGSSPSTGSGDSTPAITVIGTPVGNPVSKDIDASGGSLTSPDGKLELTIPAGALAASTTISIQPVTNTAPGGLGSAYQLLPEGTKFGKPVTITFHYSDTDVSGSLPYFLYIASQDSALSWEADLKQRNLDTVAKTVSITSTHFSIWSAFENIKLISGQDEYHHGETNYLEVTEVLKPSTLKPGSDPNDPLSYSLPVTSTLPDNLVSNWSLNGEGTNTLIHGNITGSGAHVTYKAPASIDQETTVQVSVEVKFTDYVTVYSGGKQLATFNKLILAHPIELLPDGLAFNLLVEYEADKPASDSDDYSYTYYDHATMDIAISGVYVSVSNIQNYPPVYHTTAGAMCSITTVYPDTIGELNVTSGHGFADAITNNAFDVELNCSEEGDSFKYDFKCCTTCDLGHAGGIASGLVDLDPYFKLMNIRQIVTDSQDVYHYIRYTIAPR